MKHRQLAENLHHLRDHDENWPAFADFCKEMMVAWHKNLSKFNLAEESMEKIAKDRIVWTSMIKGVETLFVQMDQLITELKNIEKEEESKNAG